MNLLEKFINWFFFFESNDFGIHKHRDKYTYVHTVKLEEPKDIIIKKSNKRPETFKDYVGQHKAKTILKGYIEGTKSRNTQFPHLLIHGPAGCGKTTLAKIIANELQYPFIEVVASEITNTEQLVDLILDNEKALVFLDEIHGLKRDFVEPLYPLMEDFKHGDTELSPFTIIGATTEIGEIIKNRKPFYDRFVLKQELQDYTWKQIFNIIKKYNYKNYSKDILPDKTLEVIAKNSRLTPRVAIGLVQSVIYLKGNVELTLNSNNIIYNGFTKTDLKAMKVIAKHNRGIGVQALAAFLNVSQDTYSYQIEPWLLKTGCILRTSKGRKITNYGIRLINKLG